MLGKYESAFKLRPVVAQVTWTRRDANQDVVDYEHFTIPFILTVDEILSKIENLTLREMPGGTFVLICCNSAVITEILRKFAETVNFISDEEHDLSGRHTEF